MKNLLDATLNYADHSLTNKELAKLAPSIFTDEPYKDRSVKNFIPTSSVVDAFRDIGLEPVLATQMRSKQNPAHSKHMIRFRFPDHDDKDYSREIVLVNSNDGLSTYVLMAGIYRSDSDSALIVSDDLVPSIKVRHTADAIKNLLDGVKTLESMFKVVDDRIAEMKEYNLDIAAIVKLAEDSLDVKYPDDTPRAIRSADLLVSRRDSDKKMDLWTVFNVIQENLVKGGLVGTATTNPDRSMKTKPIRNINENVRVNQELWKVADAILPKKASKEIVQAEKTNDEDDLRATISNLRKQLRALRKENKALKDPQIVDEKKVA